jgi:hypothetical protein
METASNTYNDGRQKENLSKKTNVGEKIVSLEQNNCNSPVARERSREKTPQASCAEFLSTFDTTPRSFRAYFPLHNDHSPFHPQCHRSMQTADPS